MIFNFLFLMGQTGNPGGLTPMLLMFGAIFVIMYFLMIRPQQKRQRDHQKMLDSLEKNDKVVTIGGVYGTIQGLKEQGQNKIIILKIDDNVKIEIKQSAIAGKVE